MLAMNVFRRGFGSTIGNYNKSYLCPDFINCINNHFEKSVECNYIPSLKKPKAIDVENIINTLPPNADNLRLVRELVYNLRLSKDASDTHISNSYSVMKYIEFLEIEDFTMVLNRLDYGIFVDSFLGCYLMDYLLKKQEFQAAVQVANQLSFQEDLDSDLLLALSVMSCYKYVQSYVSSSKSSFQEVLDSVPEKKLRIKYLRNLQPNLLIHDTGKTLLKLSEKCHSEIKVNTKILGLLLCNKNEELFNLLLMNEGYFEDILSLCLDYTMNGIYKQDGFPDIIQSLLKKNSSSRLFTQAVEEFIKNASIKDYPKIIETQKQNFLIWKQRSKRAFNKFLENKRKMKCQQNFEELQKQIYTNRQKLWFFNNEENIDLQTYCKRTFYPKKWFGKKKNPKHIDDNYVPPEITRK